VEGEFQWHRHADTDETFIVLGGELRIEFRAGPSGDGSIVLRAGQMAVVPKGVEHKPCANAEVKLLLIEPRGVVNTGDGAAGERTEVGRNSWRPTG
ncbi:TPA: cupin domain-containing protein, partial [Burkholderia vietnamiensis]|nr:cupin domain-containing protein [Burkholderia vietnamiensis]HDR9319892.1 cupin domain-containing protein [Burkholderia vietnamiensis]